MAQSAARQSHNLKVVSSSLTRGRYQAFSHIGEDRCRNVDVDSTRYYIFNSKQVPLALEFKQKNVAQQQNPDQIPW